MSSQRGPLLDLIEHQHIDPANIDAALRVAEVYPNPQRWRMLIDWLLLGIGGASLAASAVFFIAYNWEALGRFAQFGLVEFLLLIATLAFLTLGRETTAGKMALLVASILVGVLMALFGQTYQTGADPWELFFNWALAITPWVLISRLPVLWLLWLLLFNLAALLYYHALGRMWWWQRSDETALLWTLFLGNAAAQAAWEGGAQRWPWLSARWAVRVVALACGFVATWMVERAIFDEHAYGALAWLLWMGISFYLYRNVLRDLFMLAGVMLSGIVVVVSFIGHHMQGNDAGAFLVLAMFVVGLGSAAAVSLRSLHRKWES